PVDDTCFPKDGPTAVRFFDDFSWRNFIALMWPAERGSRGLPNRNAHLVDGGTRVFETYKADWETFRPNPTAWDEFEASNPCAMQAPQSNLVLASNSKFSNFWQGHFKAAPRVHALPARRHETWVTYQTAFNSTGYRQILKMRADSKISPAKGVLFGDRAVTIKSAWLRIPDAETRKNYYNQLALVFDPASAKCVEWEMSLVGLHIVVQTPQSSPYWIWSTFEHVDNVPPSTRQSAFNDGGPDGLPDQDPNAGGLIDWAHPKTYNVVREERWIKKETEEANKVYQAKAGGIWSNYRLVMTQWPDVFGQDPDYVDSQRMRPRPVGNSDAAANPVLETFVQRVTCMSCHEAAVDTNYVWALEIYGRAGIPSNQPPTLTPALRKLEKLLEGEALWRRKRGF
ncbi:MAG TPA: hypothetical protein VNT81_23905, partial [Vicinamibacterales bacterium]|nr:hypothetical protein [Vicinamibacterales bacterium]